jgi:hypothetical protein
VVGDRTRERGLVGVRDVEETVFVHESRVLLPFVRNARRERCDMPVDMCVALIAPQRQNVEPLSRYDERHGSTEPMHATLKLYVFVLGEVTHDSRAVFERCDKRVANECRVHREKTDADVVASDDQMTVEITRDDRADEARSASTVCTRALHVTRDIERDSRVVGHPARMLDPRSVG